MKINENNIVFPDGTDESANFRDQTITSDSGETLYFAPVRVQTESDLQTFGVTKEARWTLPFGKSSDKYQVLYFVTPNKALADDFWEKINTQHSQEYRKRRCMIPGKLKPLIPCPDCNSCACCPYPEYRDRHEMKEIVFDDEIKVTKTPSTESPDILRVITHCTVEAVRAKIREVNPLFEKAIYLKEHENYSVDEIAEELNCSEHMVRYYLRKAKEIGRTLKKYYR